MSRRMVQMVTLIRQHAMGGEIKWVVNIDQKKADVGRKVVDEAGIVWKVFEVWGAPREIAEVVALSRDYRGAPIGKS